MRMLCTRAVQRCAYRPLLPLFSAGAPIWVSRMQRAYASSMESLPRVAQPSVWNSMVPRFFRERKAAVKKSTVPKSKEWNPATFYIIMFLLIGSNAIQMIALRNDFTTFSRKADAKIGLLREVLERVQRGEDVDVEGLLGTGNEEKEKEWEEGS